MFIIILFLFFEFIHNWWLEGYLKDLCNLIEKLERELNNE